MRILIHAPDTPAIDREAAPGTTLLVGRAPDPSRGEGAVESVEVRGERVSANHALVTCDARGATVRDLGSRNGTWVRVLPSAPVSLAGATIALELAGVAAGALDDAGPRAAEWA